MGKHNFPKLPKVSSWIVIGVMVMLTFPAAHAAPGFPDCAEVISVSPLTELAQAEEKRTSALRAFLEAHTRVQAASEHWRHLELSLWQSFKAHVITSLPILSKNSAAAALSELKEAMRLESQFAESLRHANQEFETVRRQNHLSSREEFNDEVSSFLIAHRIELRDLLNFENSAFGVLRSAFFSVPAIAKYLSRDVTFENDHPVLAPGEENHARDNFYETEIYRIAGEKLIPYRENASSRKFYTDGSVHLVTSLGREDLQAKYPFTFVSPIKDVYKIRSFVNRLENTYYSPLQYDDTTSVSYVKQIEELKEASTYKFQLFPMIKDDHATTLVTVYDPAEKRVLASVFLDSSATSDEYYRFIESRWNMPNVDDQPVISRFLDTKIWEHVQNNVTNLPFDLLPTEQNYFRRSGETGQYVTLVVNKKLPLLNASHNLQLQSDDMNCSLYSLNFLEAIGHLLSIDGDRVYSLAKQFADGNPTEKEAAAQSLQNIFQIELKEYLSQYYQSDGTPETFEHIKQHHLKQRWQMGTRAIQKLQH